MENIVLWQLIGFVVCLIVLFVLTAQYRAALARETDFEAPVEDLTVVTVAQKPEFKPRAAVLHEVKGNALLEIADLKDKVKELAYQLEEVKIGEHKTGDDIAKQLARMEQRISTFEQEYVNKLQPTLLSLIQELESLKLADETPQLPAEPLTEDKQ